LLREEKLEEDARAGTVHNLQGSEASVVIFDLVNDEPQWRVGMFIQKYDDMTRRLLNVALTRARRRLIIVGDFNYIEKHSKKAFIGSKFIPFLRISYPCIDALDVVNSGLAAKAVKAQTLVTSGDVIPDEKRLVVTQEHFYKFLINDLTKAKQRIIIYSPFITQNRLSFLELQLRAAMERGVNVYVVTKSKQERKKERNLYEMLEKSLAKWGVIIIHKRGMHEKLIFIDDDILWEGSLNPLSFSNTSEHMERRVSRTVVKDYAHNLRLSDLVGEYEEGTPTCPVCGKELIACEGRDDPFYWRCIDHNNGCFYTRSIDQPPLKDGIIKCRCGSDVEYGEWGGKPAWRCTTNRHHHQPIVRTHLFLLKMREMIPPKKRSKLDKLFGVSHFGNQRDKNGEQGELFPSV
jgi:hypothetical protein